MRRVDRLYRCSSCGKRFADPRADEMYKNLSKDTPSGLKLKMMSWCLECGAKRFKDEEGK